MILFTAILRHYWVDHLDPWVIHFTGDFGIRWYGLAYLAGFLLGGLILTRWGRRGRLPIPPEELPTFIGYAMAGVIIGGRLGYCSLYQPRYVFHHPLEIFEMWHGGMASHGGIAGLILALWLYGRSLRINPMLLIDAAAATGPLGIVFGRIANFVNGELWGRPTTVPWAVIFPRAPLVNGVQVPRHPSQLYAALIEGVLVFLVGQWVYGRSKRPGLTTAVVAATYGIGRFIDEFWREPDLGQPGYWGWMSKGQLFSIPMIVLGAVFAIWLLKRARYPRGKGEAHQP